MFPFFYVKPDMQKELFHYLSNHVTPERLELFNKIAEYRTQYLTVVLEDIYQSQNASAVLRTCDCFGVQDVHIIENRNEFRLDTEVSLGSSKWLTMHRYNKQGNNSVIALKTLREQGYRIVATSPHSSDTELPDFDIEKGKFALVFGSEMPGISDNIVKHADEFLRIPMFGFTESFNISVSVAVILQHLTYKIRKSDLIGWEMSEMEKIALKTQWLRNTIKRSELIEKRFWQDNQK